MKLYEIKDELVETLDLLMANSDDELAKSNCEEMIDYLKEELKNKSDSIIKFIRNLEAERDIAKLEIDRLSSLKKSKERKISWLKEYVVSIMLQLNQKKIETDLGSYGIVVRDKVEIIDANKIPEEYMRIKTEKQPDKIKIADFLKKFGELTGVKLNKSYSLQIR